MPTDDSPPFSLHLAQLRYSVSQPKGDPMTTTMIHVRIEEKVKAEATKALAKMGLSMSDAVRVLMVRVAADKALPFSLEVPNAKTRAAMREPRAQGRRAKTTAALMAELNADD
jgi:DNA-damage-inducible protein J